MSPESLVSELSTLTRNAGTKDGTREPDPHPPNKARLGHVAHNNGALYTIAVERMCRAPGWLGVRYDTATAGCCAVVVYNT